MRRVCLPRLHWIPLWTWLWLAAWVERQCICVCVIKCTRASGCCKWVCPTVGLCIDLYSAVHVGSNAMYRAWCVSGALYESCDGWVCVEYAANRVSPIGHYHSQRGWLWVSLKCVCVCRGTIQVYLCSVVCSVQPLSPSSFSIHLCSPNYYTC